MRLVTSSTNQISISFNVPATPFQNILFGCFRTFIAIEYQIESALTLSGVFTKSGNIYVMHNRIVMNF